MSAPVSLQIFVGFLIFFLIFGALERRFPLRPQPIFRSGWTTDLIYYVAGCFVGKFSDAASLGAMLLLRPIIGVDIHDMVANQPDWLQFIEILLICDFLAYLYHRAMHRVDWLWRFHKIHHASHRLDWLANVRLHPIDKIMGDCFQFIPVFLIRFDDMALLVYTIFLGFQGFLNHSNVKIRFGLLRWVIASPEFHHWHHSDNPRTYNKNFAPHLVIFDLLFGTAYFPPDRSLPESYGMSEPLPERFWGQMISPLRWERVRQSGSRRS